MIRPIRPIVAIVLGIVASHAILGLVATRLARQPYEVKKTTKAEFASIREEALAVRAALEIERLRGIPLDEMLLGKNLRRIASDDLGMTLRLEGWEYLRIEPAYDGSGSAWTGQGEIRRDRKWYTVTIRQALGERGDVVTIREGH